MARCRPWATPRGQNGGALRGRGCPRGGPDPLRSGTGGTSGLAWPGPPSPVEWIAAVSLAAGAAAVGYLAYKKFLSKDKCCKAMVNPSVQKDNPKVVHAFDVEDLGDKAVYCRCWRSKKFPLCDGSHIKHNEETGDNVGPLIIKRKEA
ncbi:CDGSH iron-sulfur domain-containing protein 1 isoform X1 [Patagioenas fasciata]|uniref:CDGSH iron-sulfur domain-containing protein 1 isoform X1 n=1 Tax=Patagioenas fasciata TaxID=372321 RepID=UPI003A9A45B0